MISLLNCIQRLVWFSLACWFFFTPISVKSQQKAGEVDLPDIESYKKDVKELIGFLEFSLNMLGNPQTTARERDIIINDSYTKLFRDAKVQIEDDLIPERSSVTYKPVQAYLKDIGFFYRNAVFDLTVSRIDPQVNDQGQIFFKVTLDRNLQGITVDGDTINESQKRYVEVNLDRENKLIEIASMYTTRLSEQASMRSWWEGLTPVWKRIFGPMVHINDSLNLHDVYIFNDTLSLGDTLVLWDHPLGGKAMPSDSLIDSLGGAEQLFYIPVEGERLYADLKALIEKESLDLSDFPGLRDLSPLDEFANLRRLDISGTGVESLFPLRNLTRLQVLRIAGCPVRDLSPLKYATSLEELYAEDTRYLRSAAFEQFKNLRILDLTGAVFSRPENLKNNRKLEILLLDSTEVVDLHHFSELTSLRELSIAFTQVNDLGPISELNSLELLHIEDTPISDLTPLKGLENLRLLFCDRSRIITLDPLLKLPSLEKVYCDGTPITQTLANQFMSQKPGTLVIYASQELKDWYENLPGVWLEILEAKVPTGGTPNREHLQQMANIRHLDLSNNKAITYLDPLVPLINLEELNLSNTPIHDLGPLSGLLNLRRIILTGTRVDDLFPLTNLSQLEFVDITFTEVHDLAPLGRLPNLRELLADYSSISNLMPLADCPHIDAIAAYRTGVNDSMVSAFLRVNPQVLVTYRPDRLKSWWTELPLAWKNIFGRLPDVNLEPNSEQLHRLTSRQKIEVSGQTAVEELKPLTMFLNLRELTVEHTRVSDLSPIWRFSGLEQLKIGRNPIQSLVPLKFLPNLRLLDCSNTPIEDLEPLTNLDSLEVLNISGTQVKDLKPLQNLSSLSVIDCSNTRVTKLKFLTELPNLTEIRCFNTRISLGKVERFRKERPKVVVVYY